MWAREVGERQALIDPPQGASQISIEVLEAQKSGIYVCVNSQSPNSASRFQRVFLLKLKNTALDRAHGFKINLSPDGSDKKGDSGLIFSSNDDCFKLEKGIPTVVEFVARTSGTYSFRCCNRCGIGHGGMKGQLIVEP